ncbi:MAG: (d)CMP kinase [Oscillospiraceae bacterium]|nr:(d)CMP kinase [Oscillospiraceae bacterium]
MNDAIYSVAIDGPGGAGKSTIARKAAERLGFVYVDTGAIYRTVAYAVNSFKVDADCAQAVTELLPRLCISLSWDNDGVQHMHLNARDVTDHIRTPEIAQLASKISALPAVRDFLMETQRETARKHCVVMDGRDIGTVVLPNADVKIFLTASPEVRARRRYLELQSKGSHVNYEQVLSELQERDYRDSHRAVAPLKAAEDALLLDTSDLDREQSIAAVTEIIQRTLDL